MLSALKHIGIFGGGITAGLCGAGILIARAQGRNIDYPPVIIACSILSINSAALSAGGYAIGGTRGALIANCLPPLGLLIIALSPVPND